MPPILAAVHKVFLTRKADRIHTTRLLAELGIPDLTPKRLGTILAACGVQPHGQPFVEGGQRGRGYLYTDINAAVRPFQHGTTTAPPHAYATVPKAADDR